MVECCNTPDVTFPICTPTLAVSGVKLFYFLGFGFLSPCVVIIRFVSSRALHCIAYVFVSCIRAFSPLSVLHSGAPMTSGVPFYLFLCAGIKRSRIGPRLSKRPWFTTGRPPVKFCTIWTSFDTPTVNRGTEKASCVLQPNTPPKWPKTHLNLLHYLGRSITIAWPKTAPHLDSPSSLYVYIKTPPNFSFSLPPKP